MKTKTRIVLVVDDDDMIRRLVRTVLEADEYEVVEARDGNIALQLTESAHPAVVSDLLKAQVQANNFIKTNPTQAQADANAELATYTGKPLKPDLVAASFKEITFTNDPNAASLKTAADQAVSLGLLQPVNLDGIYALDPLNKVLAAAGESQISS